MIDGKDLCALEGDALLAARRYVQVIFQGLFASLNPRMRVAELLEGGLRAQQPDLDASRVLVTGGSYGGYMTLASSVVHSERIVGGVPIVGPSNFVTFLTNTESYRRDLRRAEYGDERDPATRAWMEKTAPLNNADRIRKPLFVVQGKNDPRVPYTESEQIVAKVRANGLPVWYLRGENEGHGFARKENADFLFYAMVRFVEERLLK